MEVQMQVGIWVVCYQECDLLKIKMKTQVLSWKLWC